MKSTGKPPRVNFGLESVNQPELQPTISVISLLSFAADARNLHEHKRGYEATRYRGKKAAALTLFASGSIRDTHSVVRYFLITTPPYRLSDLGWPLALTDNKWLLIIWVCTGCVSVTRDGLFSRFVLLFRVELRS